MLILILTVVCLLAAAMVWLMQSPDPAWYALVVSLPHRQTDLARFTKRATSERVRCRTFPAVYGKDLDPMNLSHLLSDELTKHVMALSQRGNLGACFSHLGAIRELADYWPSGSDPALVFEDDVYLCVDFHHQFKRLVSEMTPDWDLLLLGWTCSYQDNQDQCQQNETCKVIAPGYIRDLNYSIGLFGYALRTRESAEKVWAAMMPLEWIIDIDLTRVAQKGDFNLVAAMPPLAEHPGYTEISSHDWSATRPMQHYRTDTNL